MTSRFIPRQRLARESIEEILMATAPGERLPSEDQLAKQLGMSRPTIRSALSALEQEGLVIRKHGVGTFASRPPRTMNASLQILNSVADIVRENGYEPSVIDIHIQPLDLPKHVLEALSLSQPTSGYRVTRTVLADGEPAVFLIDYLPTHIGSTVVDLSGFSDKMMPALAQLGIVIAYATTRISIKRSSEEAAQALGIEPHEAVLFLQQVAYTQSQIPAIYSVGYHREGFISYTITRHTEFKERSEP
ncbi:GntR family transcriptional regulator [Sulfobacillus thermosulfidooxidans]|uniref:GntR family transcriptional regulator n=1 Tax=Sulfobacillus thermosulfidooxidans TaxID=28034 RepID=UPI0006B5531F|nr:GntR family transcriptional regulator [Sulfobacillus thermosulfidooxidans]